MSTAAARTAQHSLRADAKARKQVFKPVVSNAFDLKWPALPAHARTQMLLALHKLLEDVAPYKEYKSKHRGNKKPRKAKVASEPEDAMDVDTTVPQASTSASPPTHDLKLKSGKVVSVPDFTEPAKFAPKKRKLHPSAPPEPIPEEPEILSHLVLGINGVTKCLEQLIRQKRRQALGLPAEVDQSGVEGQKQKTKRERKAAVEAVRRKLAASSKKKEKPARIKLPGSDSAVYAYLRTLAEETQSTTTQTGPPALLQNAQSDYPPFGLNNTAVFPARPTKKGTKSSPHPTGAMWASLRPVLEASDPKYCLQQLRSDERPPDRAPGTTREARIAEVAMILQGIENNIVAGLTTLEDAKSRLRNMLRKYTIPTCQASIKARLETINERIRSNGQEPGPDPTLDKEEELPQAATESQAVGEPDSIRLLFVCLPDLNPPSLVSHLLSLACSANGLLARGKDTEEEIEQSGMYVIQLNKGADAELAKALGIGHAAVVGVKASAPNLDELLTLARHHLKLPRASWLDALPPAPAPTQQEDLIPAQIGRPVTADVPGAPHPTQPELLPTHIKHFQVSVPVNPKAVRQERREKVKARMKQAKEKKKSKSKPRTDRADKATMGLQDAEMEQPSEAANGHAASEGQPDQPRARSVSI